MASGKRSQAAATRAWVAGNPPLKELKERFPDDFQAVTREIGAVMAKGDPQAIKNYAAAVAGAPRIGRATNGSREDAQLAAEVRQRMAAALLRQMGVSAVTGVVSGKLRFNLFNGWLAQRLLFKQGLERKPVSLRWFKLLWPLVWQKRFLMPLVEPKGIYNFYSSKCITGLADLIGDRRCLEIAAGDGTLSRFLNQRGLDVIATDDRSWSAVAEAANVRSEEARQALRAHHPQAVLCSWPPAGNAFEEWVFKTPSVDLYIVISSRHEFAAGNFEAYRRQQEFDWSIDEKLSRLVLPPELDSAVYVFRRRPVRDAAGR